MEEDISLRATGRTTRLVDSYIQELFNNPGKAIKIIDHHPNRSMDRYLAGKIIDRIEREHGHSVKCIYNSRDISIRLDYDRSKIEVK